MYKKQIHEYIISHSHELTDFLSELIAVKSVESAPEENTPFGKGCADVLELFLSEGRKNGFITKNFENFAGHTDFNGLAPKLGILCHLDTVPEGDGWNSDPFKAVIKDGRLYGRGAIDDKGPAAAVLFAMKCIKELNIPVKKGIRIITGCNEENGSADIEYYLKQEKFPPCLVTPDGDYPVINIEKGMLRCKITGKLPKKILSINGGEAVNAVPAKCSARVMGEHSPENKIAVSYDNGISDIVSEGVCAHASTPEKGENAVTLLLKYLAEDCGGDIKALSQLFPYGETDGTATGVKCKDDVSGALTLLLSRINGENGVFTAYCDCRYPVSLTLKEISEKLARSIENKGLKAEITMGSEPHFVDPESSFIKQLLGIYEDVTGNKGECIAIGGGTYVHDTENGVAFGAEFPGEENNMHGADESVKLSSLLLTAEIYAVLMAEVCGC